MAVRRGNMGPHQAALIGSIDFINARDGWLMRSVRAYADNHEVDIYHSTDGGEVWNKVASVRQGDESSGLPFAGVKVRITFLNATTGWVTGATNTNDWLFHVTHDGGRTWRQQKLPLPRGVASPWSAITGHRGSSQRRTASSLLIIGISIPNPLIQLHRSLCSMRRAMEVRRGHKLHYPYPSQMDMLG